MLIIIIWCKWFDLTLEEDINLQMGQLFCFSGREYSISYAGNINTSSHAYATQLLLEKASNFDRSWY